VPKESVPDYPWGLYDLNTDHSQSTNRRLAFAQPATRFAGRTRYL
jgi:hypothetical protein